MRDLTPRVPAWSSRALDAGRSPWFKFRDALGRHLDCELPHRAPCLAVHHGVTTTDFSEIRDSPDCDWGLLLLSHHHFAADAWPTAGRDFHGIGICAVGIGTVPG